MDDTTAQTIYDLQLHERVSTNNGMHSVTRVPGGWIYESWRRRLPTDDYEPYACVFVPFHNEFQPRTFP